MESKYISLTIDVEEWYHSKWFKVDRVLTKYYNGIPPRTDVEYSLRTVLDLFKTYGVRSTFFILVETYLRYPSIADMILKAGHEIALHGLSHRGCSELGQKFLMEVKEAKRLLEEHVGPIYGFRAPNGDIDSMGLQTLQRFGFKYDSSIVPCHTIPGWYGNPSSPVGPYRLGSSGIVEFPLATHPTWRLPAHGGWFLRNFGLSYIKWAIRALLKKSDIAVLYIHPWEVSNYNPRHVEIPFHVFRRTGKWTLEAVEELISYFKSSEEVSFISLKEYLKTVRLLTQ